ncbi:MAG: hypothetical protein FJW37_06295, partial [Acidobacteria bacterium]|nr:hypothetical protein [Acidobacteriota bacterium]
MATNTELVRRACLLGLLAVPSAWSQSGFAVLSHEPGSWPAILASVGFEPRPPAEAGIFVLRPGSSGSPQWDERVRQGAFLILEGESSLAGSFGFRPGEERIRAASVEEARLPELSIVWQKPLELPRFELPAGARIFARERWTGAPLLAGFPRGQGAVLWVAADPGERGYERFPYLIHALRDLGLDPPFRSARLWAFFDYGHRARVDPEYFAPRWRSAGIAALHVSAWHFFEPDPERDAYLRQLIEACHRHGVLVYAWLELPHVSEEFWRRRPECREKTALLQDAHLDWRKLINLLDRDCSGAVQSGVKDLIIRFDWDGVNLAELYFESLRGLEAPARFTPMNGRFRELFRRQAGFDPIEIFGARRDPESARKVLEFRAETAARLQEEWLAALDLLRRAKPHLDLVLTHIDDRFDARMKDALGADSARMLPLA